MDIHSMVIQAKEEGRDLDIASLTELKEDMSLDEIVWYYNNVSGKRYEIEITFFEHYTIFQDWYEIYKLSKNGEKTKKIALDKIKEYIHSIDDALEVYGIDISDEVLRTVAFERILEITPDVFDDWLYIYDESIFDQRLKKTALKKLFSLAKGVENWQKIYDRSEIGSATQLIAIQHIYGKTDFYSKEYDSRESIRKSQKEYAQMYEKEHFNSKKKDNILINKFFAADREVVDDEENSK